MTDFSDCYFCGAVAADLEEHPVIPPETDPPDARQRTVAVCPTCREKLDRVIEPVVAHLDPDSAKHDVEADDSDSAPAEHGVDPERSPGEDTKQRDGPDDTSEFPRESRRILRLLDNREFPVDRDDIVTVATNAYDVTREEAESVIDLLIERDELTEEDGTLHRPT
jgi:hypothetical protein